MDGRWTVGRRRMDGRWMLDVQKTDLNTEDGPEDGRRPDGRWAVKVRETSQKTGGDDGRPKMDHRLTEMTVTGTVDRPYFASRVGYDACKILSFFVTRRK